MGYLVEYDKNFNEIWRYKIKSPWAAIRLKNGNTLITDEADSLAREVNPKGETVWESDTRKDLDGVTAVQILDDPGFPEIPGESAH
jgi:hypothetical protein